MLSKDKLLFDTSFGQDIDSLEGDSVLIGVSEYNLDGARKSLVRGDNSGRLFVAGPLAIGQDAQLDAATIDASPTGAVRASNLVTITTTAAHGFSAGDVITVAGVTDATFNGTFIAQTVTATTFTYRQVAADATSGSGTATDHTKNPNPLMMGAVDSGGLVRSLQVNGSGQLLVSASVTVGSEFAEDSAHVSGHTGQFILAVRNDVEGSLVDADGDYAPFQVDSLGRLRVAADISVVNGHEKAEDAAHASADIGSYMLSVRQDTPASSTDTDGDYQSLKSDSLGRLWVSDPQSQALLTTIDTSLNNIESDIDDLHKAEDAVHASGDFGVQALAVRQDTLASSVDADGDYASLKLNSRGGLWSVPVGTVADDVADTENPVKIGSRAVSALPAAVAANDRADMISDLRRRLFVHNAPNISSLGSASSVTTAAAALLGAQLAGRTRIMIQNLGNKDIFVGDSGLTLANGLRISAGSTLSLDLGDQISLFAIASSGTQDIRVLELA